MAILYVVSDGSGADAADLNQIINALSSVLGITDSAQSALGRLVLPSAASAPGSPAVAQVYFNTVTGIPYIRDSSGNWVSMIGKKPIVRVYESNNTWTKPAGLSYIRVRMVGGGGGGGGVAGVVGTAQGAGGGGGGGYSESVINASDLRATETVVVGGGGGGGSSSGDDGNDGGASAFATTGAPSFQMSANGGLGAGGLTGSGGGTDGGSGAIGSTGDIVIGGSDGAAGITVTASGSEQAMSGAGGSSMLGGGGGGNWGGNTGIQAGRAGNQYGGGGGGGLSCFNATGAAGGDGYAGVVIVEEYY